MKTTTIRILTCVMFLALLAAVLPAAAQDGGPAAPLTDKEYKEYEALLFTLENGGVLLDQESARFKSLDDRLHPYVPSPAAFFPHAPAAFGPEDFESGTYPPTGWNLYETGDASDPGWVETTSQAHSSTHSAYHNDDDLSTSAIAWLVMPQYTVHSNDNLVFWQHDNYANYYDYHGIWITTGASPDPTVSTYVELVEVGAGTEDTWEEKTYSLNAYAGQAVYIAFRYEGDYADQWYIDDVEIAQPSPPNCATIVSPGDMDTDVSANTDLEWADGGGSPTGYKLSFGTDNPPTNIENGTDQGTGTTYDPTSALAYSTVHYWQVVPYNAAGDATGCSIWSFTTEADPTITPPWLEDFSGGYPPTNWTEAQGVIGDPTTLTGSTSGWIEDGFANVGTTGSAKLNIYGTSIDEWMFTPPVNLGDGSTSYQLEFDLALTVYGGTGSATLGLDDIFDVVISTDGGATWSSTNILREWSSTTPISNGAGDHIVIDLSSYTGIVKFGFYGFSDTSNADNDLFVDNVQVREPPSGPPACATNVSPMHAATDVSIDADLNWASGGGTAETGYKLYMDTFTPPTTMSDLGLVTTHDPGTLAYSTIYYWQIVAYNAAGDATGCSIWSFTTEADPTISTFPWTEDFGTTTCAIPSGWTNDTGDGGDDWKFVDGPVGSGTHGAAQDHTTGSGCFTGVDDSETSDGSETILSSPPLDITGLTAPRLAFWYQNQNPAESPAVFSELHVDVFDGTTVQTDVFVINTGIDAWTEYTIDLTSYKSASTRVYFRDVDSSSYLSDSSLDDVTVEEAPVWQGDDATNPTHWNVAANWSHGAVPNSSTNALIPTTPSGGNYPTVNANAECGGLTIQTGAHVDMSANTLDVYGDWLVEGTGYFNGTGGTVVFKGSNDQTIAMTANANDHFYHLQVGDGATAQTVTANSDLDVNGNLTIQTGATLAGGSHTINVAGNWIDHGTTFAYDTSTVVLDGGSQSVTTYQTTWTAVRVTDSFESWTSEVPDGWTEQDTNGTAGDWESSGVGTNHPSDGGTPPIGGGSVTARFNSWSASADNSTRIFTTNSFDMTGYASCQVRFWMYHDTGYSSNNDRVQVEGSTDGATFTDVGAAVSRSDGTVGWQEHTVDFSAYAGEATAYLSFEGISGYGNDCFIDLATVECSNGPTPDGASTFYNLIVNSSGNTATFNGNLDVNHDLTIGLAAKMDMGAYQASVGGALTNNGTLQHTQDVNGSADVTFFNTGGYGGLTLNANGSDLGSTTVSMKGNQDCTTTAGEAVKRCFDISPANTSSLDAIVTFYFANSELSGNDCNTLDAYRWNGSSWQVFTTGTRSCASEPYSLQATGVSDFSPFVLKSSSAPTAVTIHSVTVSSAGTPTLALVLAAGMLALASGAAIWRRKS